MGNPTFPPSLSGFISSESSSYQPQVSFSACRSAKRLFSCKAPETTEFVKKATDVHHRAMDSFTKTRFTGACRSLSTYGRSMAASIAYELCAMCCRSDHPSTLRQRCEVGMGTSDHVTSSSATLPVALSAGLIGMVGGTILHPIPCEDGDVSDLVNGPLCGLAGTAIGTLGTLALLKVVRLCKQGSDDLMPMARLIKDITDLRPTPYDFDEFKQIRLVEGRRDYIQGLLQSLSSDKKTLDDPKLRNILIQCSTLFLLPRFPNAGLRACSKDAPDVDELLARLPDSNAWDKPSTAINSVAGGLQSYMYLLAALSTIGIQELSDPQQNMLFGVSTVFNCLVKPVTRTHIPEAQYHRELVKHFWHLQLSFFSYIQQEDTTALGDTTQDRLYHIRLQSVVSNLTNLYDDVQEIKKNGATEAVTIDKSKTLELMKKHGNTLIRLLISMGEKDPQDFSALQSLYRMSFDPTHKKEGVLPLWEEKLYKAMNDEHQEKLKSWYESWISQLGNAINNLSSSESSSPSSSSSESPHIFPDVKHMMEDHSQFKSVGQRYMDEFLPSFFQHLDSEQFPDHNDAQNWVRRNTLDISQWSDKIRTLNAYFDTVLSWINHLAYGFLLYHEPTTEWSDTTEGAVKLRCLASASLAFTALFTLVRNQWVVKNGETFERLLADDRSPLSSIRASDSLTALFSQELDDTLIEDRITELLLLRRSSSSDNEKAQKYFHDLASHKKADVTHDEKEFRDRAEFILLFCDEVRKCLNRSEV